MAILSGYSTFLEQEQGMGVIDSFEEKQALSSDSNNNLVTTWGLILPFVLFALYLLCCDYL